jgi:hypothetical protein
MNKTQKGFAHIETLLILVIVIMIAAIGWFVWHSRQQADKSYDAASNLSVSASASKKKATPASTSSTSQISTKNLISYTGNNSSSGIAVQSASDIDKLEGASDSFKDFIKDKLNKNNNSPSPCGNAYGLFVKKIYQDMFALGDEKQCNNTEKLWAKVSDVWSEIGSTQTNFDCSLLEKYAVPSAIVEKCVKNGELVNNTRV